MSTKKLLVFILIIMLVLQGCKNNELESNNLDYTQDSGTIKEQEGNYSNLPTMITESKIHKNYCNKSYNINDYMQFPVQSTYQLIDQGNCYELVIAYSDESGDEREVKVFVSMINDKGIYELNQVLDNYYHTGFAWDRNGMYLLDVNFDNNRDIVVENGLFGAQGFIAYTAFIWKDGKYEPNDSFLDIPNAAIDNVNKLVLGSWRNNAASHSHAQYTFTNNKYMISSILTINWALDEESTSSEEECYIAEYILSEVYDNEEVVKEEYKVGDYSRAELESMFCESDSYWGLYGDKWKPLSFVE